MSPTAIFFHASSLTHFFACKSTSPPHLSVKPFSPILFQFQQLSFNQLLVTSYSTKVTVPPKIKSFFTKARCSSRWGRENETSTNSWSPLSGVGGVQLASEFGISHPAMQHSLKHNVHFSQFQGAKSSLSRQHHGHNIIK